MATQLWYVPLTSPILHLSPNFSMQSLKSSVTAERFTFFSAFFPCSEDGTATGRRAEESLTGKWKEKKKKNTAVIRWNDGCITQITKSGDAYSKIAYKKCKPDDAEKSDITKIE